MVDQIPVPDPVIPPTEAPVPAPEGLAGFFKSRAGKILLIVGAVVLFLGIVSAVAFIVLGNMLNDTADQVVTTVNTVATKKASVAASASADASGTSGTKIIVPVTNADVFVARDPFVPVVVESTVSSSTSASVDPDDVGKLVLQDIITQDGVKKAMLVWTDSTGEQKYVAAAGEQLGTTPWKVLSIGDTTVTMLFGDVQVTLSVGEGVDKQ